MHPESGFCFSDIGLKWEGGAGRIGGDVAQHMWGAKVSQIPVPLQNHNFYYFILSLSFRRQLENKNSKFCMLSTAGNTEEKKANPGSISGITTQWLTQGHQPTGWSWVQGLTNQDLIDEMWLKSSFILLLCLKIRHLLWSKLTQMVKGWTRWSWRCFPT